MKSPFGVLVTVSACARGPSLPFVMSKNTGAPAMRIAHDPAPDATLLMSRWMPYIRPLVFQAMRLPPFVRLSIDPALEPLHPMLKVWMASTLSRPS